MKKIFISYSTRDKKKVGKIKRDMQEVGHLVWIYPEAIDFGRDILKEEKEGIRQSDFVLVMRSANAIDAEAVKHEIALTQQEERRTGKKKLIVVDIDRDLPLNTGSIQKCNLSDPDNYASQFYKLMKQIDEHNNFKINVERKRSTDGWVKFTLSVKGNLSLIREVDYHLHPDIETRDFSTDIKKKFGITFYTPDNEIVYAVIRLNNNRTEEIRIEL